MPTYDPFWKKPIDTSNKTAKSARSQIRNKPKANRGYMKKYAKYVKVFHEKNGILTTLFGVLIIAQTMNQTAMLQIW